MPLPVLTGWGKCEKPWSAYQNPSWDSNLRAHTWQICVCSPNCRM